MKYMILGLGAFGASLAEKLTASGHEVIGVDISMTKVENLKKSVLHVICMDATDESTVKGLPIAETDVVVVAIGEDQGANIMVTALMKNMQVKRLVSRAINNLHEKVLMAIGVDEIVHPEEETAERWAKKLALCGLVDSFELGTDYSIVEINVPASLVGKRLNEIRFRESHNLLVVTTLKDSEVKNSIGREVVKKVQGLAASDLMLEKDDILVVYGSNAAIEKFMANSN